MMSLFFVHSFGSPLLVTLQALVNDDLVDGDMNVIHTATSYVRGILRAIKMAEDAVDTQVTPVSTPLCCKGYFLIHARYLLVYIP